MDNSRAKNINKTFYLLFMLGLFAPFSSYSQSEKKFLAFEQHLKKEIEGVVTDVVHTLLASSQSYVNVTVRVKGAPSPTAPYKLNGVGMLKGREGVIRSLKFIRNLEIVIYVDEQVGTGSLDAIASIVAQRLRLPDRFKRGLSFQKIPITGLMAKKNDLEIEKELNRATEDLAQKISQIEAQQTENLGLRANIENLEQTKSALERERNDLKRDSIQRKTKLDLLDLNLEKIRKDLSDTKLVESRLKSTKERPFWQGQEISSIYYLVITLIVILVGLLLKQGMGFIAKGLKAISDVVKSLSGSLQKESSSIEEKKAIKEEGLPKLPSAAMPLPPLPPEAIKASIDAIKKEILTKIKGTSQAVFLSYLTRQLSTPQTHYKSILALELIGKEFAEELFQKLPLEHRITINDAIQSPHFPGPKSSLMLQVAEEIKTSCFSDSYHKVISDLNAEMEIMISQLEEREQIDFLLQSNSDDMARIVLYLRPKIVSKALLENAGSDKLRPLSRAIASAPSSRQDTAKDAAILAKLKTYVQSIERSDTKMFHDFYNNIINKLSDKSAEAFVNEAKGFNQDLEDFFAKTFVAFSEVFNLATEALEDIISQLSSSELALLSHMSDDNFKATIKGYLNDRRLSLLDEELENLKAEEQDKIELKSESMRSKVVKLMKLKKAQNSLSQLNPDKSHKGEEGES